MLPKPSQNSIARWFTFVAPHKHWPTEITRPTLSDTMQSRKIGLPPPKSVGRVRTAHAIYRYRIRRNESTCALRTLRLLLLLFCGMDQIVSRPIGLDADENPNVLGLGERIKGPWSNSLSAKDYLDPDPEGSPEPIASNSARN